MNDEWGFYQIPHTGLVGVENEQVREDVDVQFFRTSDMKIANFGALNMGPRRSDDYTRTELFFPDKDNLSDWRVITEDGGAGGRGGLRSVSVDVNPYVWGSTVKKIRDDQFFRMDMVNNETDNEIAKPKFDVMDTDVVTAEGIVDLSLYKNYPTEGWRSFGGKYDFLPYTGVLGKPRGNG